MNHETVRFSRRGFIRTSAAFAAAAMVPRVPRVGAAHVRDVDDAGTLDRVWRQSASPNQRILLKGGTVVSMDPEGWRLRERRRADRGKEDRRPWPPSSRRRRRRR